MRGKTISKGRLCISKYQKRKNGLKVALCLLAEPTRCFSLSLTKNILKAIFSRESLAKGSVFCCQAINQILLYFQIDIWKYSSILSTALASTWPYISSCIKSILNIARYFANHSFQRVPQWAQYSAILPALFGLKYCNIPSLRAPASPRAGLDIYNFNIQPHQLPPEQNILMRMLFAIFSQSLNCDEDGFRNHNLNGFQPIFQL